MSGKSKKKQAVGFRVYDLAFRVIWGYAGICGVLRGYVESGAFAE